MKTKHPRPERIFELWSFILVALFVWYGLGGSLVDDAAIVTSHASNFIISGMLANVLMVATALVSPPVNTRRLRDLSVNILSAKYVYIFGAIFAFVLFLNIIFDVIGLNNISLLGATFSQTNVVDSLDALAGGMGVAISAGLYYANKR